MRALVVAPEPFFTPRGTPFSVYFRSLVLAEQGVEIDLLTYGEGREVVIDGVRILRIPRWRFLGPVRVGPSVLKAFLDLQLFAKMVRLLLRNDYDFVAAHEESAFFCVLLEPLFRFRWVYDMHSSLPEQLVNFRFTRSRLLIALFRALESRSLQRADAVITISPSLAEYATARMPDPSRHVLIENTLVEEVRLGSGQEVDEDGHDPGSDAISGDLPLPRNRPLVAYCGTFERYQGLDLLLQAFSLVHEERPDAFLVVVGGSKEQVVMYRRLADELGLGDHSLIHEVVSQEVARRLLRRAIVGVSPRTDGLNTPSKVYEHLALGVPLVATRVPAHTQVLREEVCFLTDPDPKALAEGLLAALTDPERRRRVAEAGRAEYERRYGRSVYQSRVEKVLELLNP